MQGNSQFFDRRKECAMNKCITKLSTIFILTLVSTVVGMACSSNSSDDTSTVKAAAETNESNFQLKAPFTEIRPKVRIDKKYTCHGENLSPRLTWTAPPPGTETFALIAEDIDHHTGIWVHWVLYNIPASTEELTEGVPTSTNQLPDGSMQGINDEKAPGYNGPCPIPNVIPERDGSGGSSGFKGASFIDGPHRYVFTIYALDEAVALTPGAKKADLVSAMEGHILGQAESVGKLHLPPTIDSKAEQDKMREALKNQPTPTAKSY